MPGRLVSGVGEQCQALQGTWHVTCTRPEAGHTPRCRSPTDGLTTQPKIVLQRATNFVSTIVRQFNLEMAVEHAR